jgi:hypothetical protein
VSLLAEALAAVKQALTLTQDDHDLRQRLADLSFELRDHERRITRMEAKWEAAVELAVLRASKPRIEGSN